MYVDGLKVGHLSNTLAVANRKAILATIAKRGCAAVSVMVVHGNKSHVILEPEDDEDEVEDYD